jgi:hypothetical protein
MKNGTQRQYGAVIREDGVFPKHFYVHLEHMSRVERYRTRLFYDDRSSMLRLTVSTNGSFERRTKRYSPVSSLSHCQYYEPTGPGFVLGTGSNQEDDLHYS